MKKNLLLTQVLLLLCLCWLCFCEDFPTSPVFENDVRQISLLENHFLGYVYYTSNEASSNKLSLTFYPHNMTSDPGHMIVYFSKFEEMSNLTSKPQFCFISKVSPCVYTIPPELNHIYFLFQCVIGTCNYQFRLSHFSEIHLRHNVREHFIFADQVQLFNFSIPKKNDFSRILFLVQYRYIPDESDLLYASQIINVEVNSGSPLIQKIGDMHIMIFNNTDEKLCSECNVTAFVSLQKGAIVEIEVLLYEVNTLTLELNRCYIDYLILSQNNNYVLSIDEGILANENFTLLININSLSGSQKTLYVNVDSAADPPMSSTWKSSTLTSYYEEESIVIKKSDLDFYQNKGTFYFLTVMGDSQGLYSLQMIVQENKILPLQLGAKQTGLIRNKEIISYKLQIWKNDDIVQGLILSATIMSGHIKVFGRSCGEYDLCRPITLEEIQKKEDISIETSDETINSYKFYPSCQFQYCFYIFAVLGDSSSTNSSKFDLVLQKENMLINLIENQCYETQINKMEVAKFKLSVEKTSEEIESVTFFLNSELDYIVTRKLICEKIDASECESKIGNLYNPIIYENKDSNKDLSGDYYLHVFGLKSAEFIIFPEIQRKGRSQKFIKLLEGKAMKYFVSFARKVAYFEFLVDVQEPTKIEINVQSNELNALKLYLSKGGENFPSADNYYLSSLNNYLSFDHDSYSQVVYRLAVEGKVFNSEFYQNHSVDFSLMYSTDHTIKHLETNQPYYDTISSMAKKKFLFYFDTNNEVVYLSQVVIQPEDYTLDMSLNLDRNNEASQYPNFGTKTQSAIKLTADVFKTYCSEKSYQKMYGKCPIYVTITNPNYEDVYFILNARTKESAIQLKQGKEQTTRINEEEKSISLYFIPTYQDKPIDVSFYSLKFKFDVYVSIYHNAQSDSQSSWVFPTHENNAHLFTNKHRVTTLIKPNELTYCWPKCVVLFTLKPDRKNNDVGLMDDLFHMMVSNGFTELTDNKPIQFHSEQGNLKFFSYSLRSVSDHTSILIDLTNLAGFSEVYICLNDDSMNEVYPMKDNFDYYSSDGHLSLSIPSLLAKKVGDAKKLSNIYIGVECIKSICESDLNVRVSNQMIQKISHGRPYDFMTNNKNEAVIFEYYHYSDQSFEFKINKEKGQGTMQMVPCFLSKVEDCILNHTKEVNLHSFSSSKIQISKSDTEHYCFNCIYLVAIVPNNSILSGTFNVVLEKEFLLLPEGRKFYDDLAEDEENLYSCKAPIKEELEVIVNVYHDEPELYVSRTQGLIRNKYEFKAMKKLEPVISVTLEPNFDNPNVQINDEIYIIVYSKATSNYSITCKSKSSYAILHSGLIEFAEIKPQQTQTYLYNSNEANVLHHTPKISLGYMSSRVFSLLVALRFKPTKSDEWGSVRDSNFQDFTIHENNTVFSLNSQTFALSNMSGIYEITIINHQDASVLYSIALQTGEINVMPYDTLLDVQIFPDEWIYYETYIPIRGFFVLDLIECVGTLDVFTARDHEKLMNHEFEEEFKVFQSQPNLKILKLGQGTLYLAMKLVGNSTKDVFGENANLAAFGQLSSHFYENYEDIPQYRLAVPDDGNIDYFFNFESKKTLVNYKSIYCVSDCNDDFLQSVKVNYTLFVSENAKTLGGHGKCGLKSYQSYNLNITNFMIVKSLEVDLMKEPQNMLMSFVLNTLTPNYYVSLIAKIEGYPSTYTPINMYYRDLNIKKPELRTQRIIAYGVSIGLGILVIILAFCGCYYYGGYRKLVNKLKYEVKDVENVGAVTSLNASIEMKSTRYEGLMMDDKL